MYIFNVRVAKEVTDTTHFFLEVFVETSGSGKGQHHWIRNVNWGFVCCHLSTAFARKDNKEEGIIKSKINLWRQV